MSDFVNKYKATQGGVKSRQMSKETKKGVTKALHETFKMAMTGQVAGIMHNGVQYMMLRQDVFQGIIQNGGQLLVNDEQREFHQNYQILMHMMQNLNIEVPEESELFDEIDQFSFDFSQNMNDPKGAKKRKEILKEFHETIAEHPLLVKMQENIMKQMNPQQKEEVANNGKLT